MYFVFYVSVTILFHVHVTISVMVFVKISQEWPGFIKHFVNIEKTMMKYKPINKNVTSQINKMAITIFITAASKYCNFTSPVEIYNH